MTFTRKPLIPFVCVALIGSITGCVHRDVVVLKNPQTGQAVTCQSTTGSGMFPIMEALSDNQATKDCATGYEAAGFQRVIPAN